MAENKRYYFLKLKEDHNINVGSDYVIIARYNNTTQNLCSRLSIDDVKEIMMKKIAVEPHYLKSIKEYAETKQNMCPEDFVCSVCHSSICVSDNGNIYPCAGWQDYVVGNVNEMSLNDIWRTSAKIKYLRSLSRRDFPQCLQCSAKGFCTMCMVRNANENPFGDPLVVNEYFCQIAKMNKEIALCRLKQFSVMYSEWLNSRSIVIKFSVRIYKLSNYKIPVMYLKASQGFFYF